MGAASKRAKKVRSASEFDLVRLAAELRQPRSTTSAYAWDLDAIRGARDAQMIGRFRLPAQLARSMRTDDACFVAYQNRLAPQRSLPVRLVPPRAGAKADRVCDEAEALFGAKGVGIHPDTLADVNGCLANHGLAIGINVTTPRLDGSRVDVEMKSWPIDHVWWDPSCRTLMTRVEGESSNVPIVHGDGRWVVFRKHEHEPWTQDAALLAGSVNVWAVHAFALRDLSKGSTSHGNAKIVGTLPEGVPIDSEEGLAFLELLRVMANTDSPVGIKPFGSTLDYIVNTSSAWQIFKEQIEGRERAAARIYLGQDGTLGQSSGAPGVDALALFGVSDYIVDGDLEAITRGIRTGVIEPWAAMNFGDSTLAPTREYQKPDTDEDARHESEAKRAAAFHAEIKAARENRFVLTQEYVNVRAAAYGIEPPMLPVVAPPAAPAAEPAGTAAPMLRSA